MEATQQPPPAGTGAAAAKAAAEMAEIQRRQEHVIKAVLPPVWCWWVIAAALVAIGAARDSHDRVVLAIAIPVAVLVIAAVIIGTNLRVHRRVKVHHGAQPGGRGAAALAGLILLVIAVTIVTAVILVASQVPHPLTIGYAAGAAVLVIGGPLLNRYLGWLMLSKARQPLADKPALPSPWRGLLASDPGLHSPDHAESTSHGGAA